VDRLQLLPLNTLVNERSSNTIKMLATRGKYLTPLILTYLFYFIATITEATSNPQNSPIFGMSTHWYHGTVL